LSIIQGLSFLWQNKTIDEAMENIREVIEMCLEETRIEELNEFVGFRELEVTPNV